MATPSTYMNLTMWTDESDPYSHTQLATNFDRIDKHRHTSTSGDGRQLVTDSYTDHSVTKVKLAEPCVDTSNLYDGSVTVEKLAGDLLSKLVPLGLVFAWHAMSSAATPAYGPGTLYELCDGRTITDHDFPGVTNYLLPNLIGKYLMFNVLASINATGGSDAYSLAHSHIVNAHQHTVSAHSHGVPSHGHVVPSHEHFIQSDGVHNHQWNANYGKAQAASMKHLAQRPYLISTGDPDTRRQALYVPNFNEDDTSREIPMGTAGSHDHSGKTGGVANAITTNSVGLQTGDASPATSADTASTNSALGNVTIRPPFYNLVPVMRVRNP